jgi:hypothetical protein
MAGCGRWPLLSGGYRGWLGRCRPRLSRPAAQSAAVGDHEMLAPLLELWRCFYRYLMQISWPDHLVLTVAYVEHSAGFYTWILGMQEQVFAGTML